MVIGVAGRIQHPERGQPVWRIPAVVRGNGLIDALRCFLPFQTVVLDVVGQKKLRLREPRKGNVNDDTRKAANQEGDERSDKRASYIKEVGIAAMPWGQVLAPKPDFFHRQSGPV